ncbi:hypothetical protein KCU88_g269, partial [Aureobasidium melanogenum]
MLLISEAKCGGGEHKALVIKTIPFPIMSLGTITVHASCPHGRRDTLTRDAMLWSHEMALVSDLAQIKRTAQHLGRPRVMTKLPEVEFG